MFCSIYRIHNNVNNKIYVGQTWTNIKQRFARHKLLNNKYCTKLYRAFNKHGRNNFSISLITVCSTQEVADFLENYFIVKFNSIKFGYNLRAGGARGKHSEETKQKISKANTGNTYNVGIKRSDEAKSNIAKGKLGNKNPMYKKDFSKEHRDNLSKAHMGHLTSEETRTKISLANKGKKMSEKQRQQQSAYRKVNLNKGVFKQGHQFSEESKRKMSESHKGKESFKKTPLTNEQILLIEQDKRGIKKIAKDYHIGAGRVKQIKGKV